MKYQSRIAVGVWLAALVVAIALIARTPFSADMSAFLPRSAGLAQQLLVDQLREGVASRLVLVAVERAPPAALAAVSRHIAATLRQDGRFALVSNGEASARARDRDLVWRNRYLLSPAVTAEHFSVAGLRRALDDTVAMLGSDLGLLAKRTLPADPTGEALRLAQDLAGRTQPRTVDGAWASRDGRSALLLVSTRAAGFDIDAQELALAGIAEAFEIARHAVPEAAGATLVTTGPPVFAVQSRARIKSDAEHLSLLAVVLIAGLLLFAYRSISVLALALLPVATGSLAGLAAVGATFGFIHGITIGFGVTLIGEAVDYAIYLFTRTVPGAAPRATLPRIWPTLRLGMLTSVCGFSAMLFSQFTGFAQLGLFTIVGLTTALAVTRWVVPALISGPFSGTGAIGVAAPLLALVRHRARLRWGVLGMTLAAGLSVMLHGAPYWESELSAMSPIPPAQLVLDARLRGELGAPDLRYLVVVEGPDREAALGASERAVAALAPLITVGTIGWVDAPGRFMPSQATQSARRAALPDAPTLRANLLQALAGSNLRDDIFAPFLADVAAAREGALLVREDLEGTSLAVQVDTLLHPRGAGWVVMLPLYGVADGLALARQIDGLNQPGLVFVELRGEADALLASFRNEALTLSAVGGLAIALLLGASLRDGRRLAAVTLPLAAAVVCTAALLLAGGGKLSIFNLFGLLLVVAVGSNYSLFFERDEKDRARMVASLMLADLCTVIGFGVLSLSGVPVLRGIGGTVAIGAALSLVFAAVLSPRRT